MKSIATELRLHNWDSDFVSVYPSRFSKSINHPQPNTWRDHQVKFLSVSRKYPQLFILRLIQIAVGHVMMFFFILFNSRKYDVLYFYNPRFTDSLLGLRLASLLGKSIVVDQTEMFSLNKNPKIHKIEEQWISKHATVLLAISNNILNHFKLVRKDNIYLFPILVDLERFNIDREEEKHLLGYIGSFASKDGIETLLDAVVLLKKDIPDIRLRLVGHHPKMNVLLKKVEALGIADSIEITGTVAFDEIPWLLCECDTLIMNRNDSKFAAYGYPIKLGEYFACKRTVVMSNGNGFSEDFEDGNQVYKYQINSAASLADTIKERYRNRGEADAVATRGYEYAKDYFDSKKLGDYLANIINTL